MGAKIFPAARQKVASQITSRESNSNIDRFILWLKGKSSIWRMIIMIKNRSAWQAQHEMVQCQKNLAHIQTVTMGRLEYIIVLIYISTCSEMQSGGSSIRWRPFYFGCYGDDLSVSTCLRFSMLSRKPRRNFPLSCHVALSLSSVAKNSLLWFILEGHRCALIAGTQHWLNTFHWVAKGRYSTLKASLQTRSIEMDI